MKIVIGIVDKKTGEEFLARAVQMDQKGRVTHFSIEGAPNSTWEPITDFNITQVNTEVMGGII